MPATSNRPIDPTDKIMSLGTIFGRANNSPMFWAWNQVESNSDFARRLQVIFDSAAGNSSELLFGNEQLEQWLLADSFCGDLQEVLQGLETISIAWLVASRDSCDTEANQLDTLLVQSAIEKLTNIVEQSIDRPDLDERPVASQLFGVELPLTLALTPMMPLERGQSKEANGGSTFLAELASENWMFALDSLLDEQGCLVASHVDFWRELLAGWARCWSIGKAMGLQVLDEIHLKKLSGFVQHTWKMIGPDKQLLILPVGEELVRNTKTEKRKPWPKSLVEAMVAMSDQEGADVVAGRLLKNKSNKNEFVDGEPSAVSEKSQLAILRHEWDRDSIMLSVRFDRASMQFNLARGIRLLGGNGLPEITIDGKKMKAASNQEWEVVCWHSDDEVDLLELQLLLEDGVLLQRQFLISFEDRFAMMGDVIVARDPAQIGYHRRFRPANSIQALAETENQEIYLRSDEKIEALLMPLALPEWKGDRESRFRISGEGEIELKQNAFGLAMFAPIWIDLDPSRSLLPRTWRQLTVGEELQLVAQDVATAFRIQVGLEHWLLYRAIRGKANRTFMGENHLCELFVGRFKKNGAEEILIVE